MSITHDCGTDHADHDHSAGRTGSDSGPGRREDEFVTQDPVALVRSLEASPRFRRDTPLGGIFHRGKISFREIAPVDSLHITIKGNRVSAHVDRICPLNFSPAGTGQYSLLRVLAHNVGGMAADLARRVRGLGSRHRCQLECEVVWVDEDTAERLVEEAAETASLDPEPDPGAGGPPAAMDIEFGLVDEAVHLLDSEAAPWSVQLEARVAGHLDEGRLAKAIATAVDRHPMARARKLPSQPTAGRDRWEIAAEGIDLDPLHVLDCPDQASLDAARARLQSTGVPLAESPPFRVHLARNPGGDLLMVNVNHAAMDGFGVLRVLQSVARAYTGSDDPLPELDLLEARDLPARLAPPSAGTLARRWLVLAANAADVVVPPARLAREGGSDRAGYGFHQVALSPSRTAALVDARGQATVNDVLLAALHMTIDGWNAERRRLGRRRIGVLVPANLRPEAWRHEMVGNFSLPTRITTSRRHRRTRWHTLAAVTSQTRRKKRTGMGTAMVEVLGRSALLPLWAKRALAALMPLTGNRLVDTAMLANLGRLEDVPDFGADAGPTTEMWFSPPARMPLGLAVGVVTAGDRMHLAFRYRHHQFSPEAARRFAGQFLAELDGFAVGPPAA